MITIGVQILISMAAVPQLAAVRPELDSSFPPMIFAACEGCQGCPSCEDIEFMYSIIGTSRSMIETHVSGLSQLPKGAKVRTALVSFGNTLRMHLGNQAISMLDMDYGLAIAFADADETLK